MNSDTHSVLVVTKDSKISSMMTSVLQPPVFQVTVVSDFNEGRRKLSEFTYNIIIVDSGDGSETDFAIDMAETNSTIILLVPQQHYDHISYRVEPYGILTATKPFDGFYFYNMIKIAIAVQYKIRALTSQTIKLKEKMEEIRLVNRAKMLLMQHNEMTEEEAHRYLEKTAMDSCQKRTAVAKQIIDELAE